MDISVKLKERFCKDCNIPIRLFQEPYFSDRLELYDRFYGTLEKWNTFTKSLEKYKCEQDYFEEYNRVKDRAINDIKNNAFYQIFNNEDMNKYAIINKGLPSKDVFKTTNTGRIFISIDMIKANFSALRFYNPSIFNNAETWEDFISQYTDNQHIIQSKYIRQVILGNCNPKRHITYEKYFMDIVVSELLKEGITISDIKFFSNDEIVIDVTDKTEVEHQRICKFIARIISEFKIPLRMEEYKLHKIFGTDGYYREITSGSDIEIDFKCLDNYMLPFVLRQFNGEAVTESDKVFYHEGLLAKFIEVPQIEVK